jgi:VanZ family protein
MQPTTKIPFKKFIPGIAWFIIIYILVTLPGKDIPQSNFLDEINFDKLVHMGLFSVLTVLFCWPFYKTDISVEKKIKYFITIALLVSAWGYTTELIQKFWVAIHRDYDLLDWAADSLGAIIGYIFSRKKFI